MKSSYINADKFLNEVSEIGFFKKFYRFMCIVQDAQANLPTVMDKVL